MIETLEQALAHADKCVPCTDSQRALKLLANEVRRLLSVEPTNEFAHEAIQPTEAA